MREDHVWAKWNNYAYIRWQSEGRLPWDALRDSSDDHAGHQLKLFPAPLRSSGLQKFCNSAHYKAVSPGTFSINTLKFLLFFCIITRGTSWYSSPVFHVLQLHFPLLDSKFEFFSFFAKWSKALWGRNVNETKCIESNITNIEQKREGEREEVIISLQIPEWVSEW